MRLTKLKVLQMKTKKEKNSFSQVMEVLEDFYSDETVCCGYSVICSQRVVFLPLEAQIVFSLSDNITDWVPTEIVLMLNKKS